MMQEAEPYIRIADDGVGMTEAVVDESWLRIGFSAKRTDTISAKKRRRTGEKGIGRISADRLGSVLELRTRAIGAVPVGLRVNWDDFTVTGRVLNEVAVEILNDPVVCLPAARQRTADSEAGTEIIIRQLRQLWTAHDLDVLHRELAVLVSPFLTKDGFTIRIKSDIIDHYERPVERQVNDAYVASIDLNYTRPDEPIRYKMKSRAVNDVGEFQEKSETISLNQLITLSEDEKNQLDFDLGPVRVVMHFYVTRDDFIGSTSARRADVLSFLNTNAGIGVYRDLVRVKPYGMIAAPEWDWLGLGARVASSPAGPSRPGYRIPPNRLVGALFITRDANTKLGDSSSREGLIQSAAFLALKRLAVGCVMLLEQVYRELFQAGKNVPVAPIQPTEQVRNMGQQLGSLQRDLNILRNAMPKSDAPQVERALERIEQVTDQVEAVVRSVEELASQATIYRGLASVGIAATVFGHETQLVISNLALATTNAKEFLELDPPDLDEAQASIATAIGYTERIAAWGSFVLDRVRRDKRRRRKIDVHAIIHDVVARLRPALTAVGIVVDDSGIAEVQTRTFAMDIEAAVLNLLTNAYTACVQQPTRRRIRIEVTRVTESAVVGYAIIVADSGPGVEPRFYEEIWSPLFTTKRATADDGRRQDVGTGLGLAIVDSVVKDLGGKRAVGRDPQLGGAVFRLWFPVQER